MIISRKKLGWISGISGFALGIALYWNWLGNRCWWLATPVEVEPGESFRIVPHTILIVTYTTSKLIMTAQRTKPGGNFAVQVTFTNQQPPEHCTTGPNLNGLLPAFATLTAKQEVEYHTVTTNYPISLGMIEINTTANQEKYLPWFFHNQANQNEVIIKQVEPMAAFATTIPLTIFNRMQAGCAGVLGQLTK